MSKPLNFEPLEVSPEESAQRRWVSRDPDPTVQMSIRMHASEYDQFRALCKRERRTNGDMLSVLMKSYLAGQK